MPITELMREHRVIEDVLSALDAFADALDSGDDVVATHLGDFVAFFRDYADRCHHAKEEEVLFQAMASAGCPRDTGPIALMLDEHERGRALVARLGDYARPVADWDGPQRGAIASLARDFSALLRGHIEKEDRIVFPLALQGLTAESMASVAERCGGLDAAAREAGDAARLERLATSLASAYTAPADIAPQPQRPEVLES